MDVTWEASDSFGMSESSSPYLRQIVLSRLNDFFRLEELVDRFADQNIDQEVADNIFIDMLAICERLHQEPLYFSFYEIYIKSKHHNFQFRELDCKRLCRVIEEERINYLKNLPGCLSRFSSHGERAS